MNRTARTAWLISLTVGVALATVQVAGASPLIVAPLTTISGPSPFAGCTIGASGAPGETLYPNAEEEPWLDVNPTNASNMIAVWQQDRWSNGGAHGLAAGVTHNGGLTWTTGFAHFSECAGGNTANGGDYQRASDPWVSFAPNGDAYQISLSFDATTNRNGVLVSKSSNGGNTWSEPISLIRDSGNRDVGYAFNDKESITADPTNSNYAFSRTTDGGQTWEPARIIYDRSEFNGTIGNQIVVLPNGDLINIFDEFFVHKNSNDQRGESISIIRSTDKGATWSRTSTVVAASLERGAFDPDTGRPIRAEGGVPELAVDRSSGKLYAVWQDSRFSGVDEIAVSTSSDGGNSWSAPIKVNQTPRNANPADNQAFVPNIRVAGDGSVAVTYYDFRNNDSSPGVPTDAWIVRCASNCGSASNWDDEARLSTTSFDIEQAPAARGPFGYFLGEYEGLANVGNSFVVAFIQVNNGNVANRTDLFGTRVTP